MKRRFTNYSLSLLGLLVPAGVGCQMKQDTCLHDRSQLVHYRKAATSIEYPEVQTCSKPEALNTLAPRLLGDAVPVHYKELSLEEAVQTALANSQVMRDLGGRVLSAPTTVATIYEPGIRESDGRFGTEAALSAFDAQLSTSVFWARNDRPINNEFLGGGVRILEQDTGNFRAEILKRSATGTQYAVRNLTNYDFNNAPINTFPSAWETMMEAEVRHPFLQGGGLAFNRIAGPNATPGFLGTSGVLVSRINTDIALVDFEIGVRNLVSDVENAYWELYFAYRDLDAKIAGRNSSLETWRRVDALFQAGRAGGEADKEAQAREQFFLFEAQVQNALAGTPGRGTLSGNGSTGGVFQGSGGVYASERRLRFLLGLTANDDLLMRPSDEPSTSKIILSWEDVLPEALTRREELRRQKWTVKRRELELIASRNFLLPRLDAVALYRWRGFGDHLLRTDSQDRGPLDNAFHSLTSGDYQEWQAGFQYSQAIGFRQAWSAVRNAELQVARDRSVLRDQELQVSHDLSTSVAELDRTYVLTQTNFNRRVAAQTQLDAVQQTYDAGTATLDLLLDAQRRVAEADVAYYRSLVEYTLSLKNVQLEKGTLLDYNGVFLSEGPWPAKAYADARALSARMRPVRLDYKKIARPGLVSAGKFDQHPLTGEQAQANPTPAAGTESDPVNMPDAVHPIEPDVTLLQPVPQPESFSPEAVSQENAPQENGPAFGASSDVSLGQQAQVDAELAPEPDDVLLPSSVPGYSAPKLLETSSRRSSLRQLQTVPQTTLDEAPLPELTLPGVESSVEQPAVSARQTGLSPAANEAPRSNRRRAVKPANETPVEARNAAPASQAVSPVGYQYPSTAPSYPSTQNEVRLRVR